MSWNTRDGMPYRAADARKQLHARGVELPEAVTAAYEVLDRITAAAPATPEPGAIRAAILDGANAATIDGLLLAELGHSRLRVEWAQARIDAAGRVLRALRQNTETVHDQLKVQAVELIDQLDHIAGLDQPLDALVLDGRHDDAQLLAQVDTIAAELDALYTIRDRFLLPSAGRPDQIAVDGINCSRWRDPRPVSRHARGNRSIAESFTDGLRAGGKLWYPTAEQAVQAAQPIAAEEATAREAAARAQRGVGSTVGW